MFKALTLLGKNLVNTKLSQNHQFGIQILYYLELYHWNFEIQSNKVVMLVLIFHKFSNLVKWLLFGDFAKCKIFFEECLGKISQNPKGKHFDYTCNHRMDKRKSFVFSRQYRNCFSLVSRNELITTAIGMVMHDFHGLKTITFH